MAIISLILSSCVNCCTCNAKEDTDAFMPLWLIIFLCIHGVLVLLVFGKILLLKFRNVLPNETKISIKTGLVDFDFPIKRSYENIQIANRIYIELATRKAALPIDENNDVIEEIYNSWYNLFKVIREEIKNIPGENLTTNSSARELIKLTLEILNKGLRPHLTLYQSDFRRWYAEELKKDENKNISAKEIQKKYKDFTKLVTSMKEVNLTLKIFSEQLSKFIYKE